MERAKRSPKKKADPDFDYTYAKPGKKTSEDTTDRENAKEEAQAIKKAANNGKTPKDSSQDKKANKLKLTKGDGQSGAKRGRPPKVYLYIM